MLFYIVLLDTATTWPTALGAATYGAIDDTWGVSPLLSPQEVVPGLTFRIVVDKDKGGMTTAEIDCVELTVHYLDSSKGQTLAPTPPPTLAPTPAPTLAPTPPPTGGKK